DPDLVVCNQNMATILDVEGKPAQAHVYRERAFRRQCLFVESSPTAVRTVLVLAASGFGNVPLGLLLPARTNNRIKWFIEYATPGQEAELPLFDLVFNAIGDPDLAVPINDSVARVLEARGRPVLNPPAAVARTRRDLTPTLLAGIPGVVVPAVMRANVPLPSPAELAAAGIGWPFLVRPIGSHGGKGLVRVDGPEADVVAAAETEAFYITAFHDFRSADGYWRKYRMIYVDHEPFAYHLAISQDWLVHYFSADMLAEPWKRDEECRFLEQPAQVLGAQAMDALAAIGHRLDLDFGGVDFSLLADGSILVFEANATMLVQLTDRVEDFPYKHIHVPKIFRAFEAMLEERSK
ncbi:MAG: hypothetical protein HQL37_15100, partial [Alphaproteobacteria bacterium]|nr:hypothetical protein [Alphaproteobacteria bacterium]